MNFNLLKPRQKEIVKLAQRETDPKNYREFSPIVRGPAFALAALSALALASPFLIMFQFIKNQLFRPNPPKIKNGG